MKIFIVYVGLFLFILAGNVSAKPSIRWLVWDFKPDFISSGAYQYQGYGDKLLADLKVSLPQYEHKQQVVNSKRWAVEARRANTCTPLLWQGFMVDELLYSKPYGLTAPYVVVAHKKKAHLFGSPGSILSLTDLLNRSDLVLGVLPVYMDAEQNNARYPVLHSYIAPYIGKSNVKEFGGIGNQLNLKLLDSNRVDYFIENPLTAPTVSKLSGLTNNYINYSLKEHRYHKKVAVACTDDAQGRKVIDEINRQISSSFIETFLEYMEEWNGKDRLFRKTVIDYFVNGQENPSIIN